MHKKDLLNWQKAPMTANFKVNDLLPVLPPLSVLNLRRISNDPSQTSRQIVI